MTIRLKDENSRCDIIYTLVPAQPLPTVDLSKSFRGRLLPAVIHTYIRRRYYKHYRAILFSTAVSYCLYLIVPMVKASVGEILAILAVILWMPMGLGSITTLRYDIVRLVCRTFDFWFFSTITSVIVVSMSMYFSDLRWIRVLIDWFGYHHVIFVDAHVLGLRSITYILIMSIISATIVLIWMMLGKIDGGSSFSIIEYENERSRFELSCVDVIGNGLVSLGFLLAKIVFRRRKALRSRRKNSSHTVECIIYRCKLQLEAVSVSNTALGDDSFFNSKGSSLREADTVQHLQFIKFPQYFSASDTLLPWSLAKRVYFPSWLLLVLYTTGAAGFLLSHAALVYEFRGSNASAAGFTLVVSSIALMCTLSFTGLIAVFYQRQLLKLLFRSFDFVFYSFQITTTNLAVCSLYGWDISHCVAVVSWWLWAHWVFTLDALTPEMRAMFKFRVCFAAPILCLLLADHIAIMSRIFLVGDKELRDLVIFEGVVWGKQLVIRVIPFYVSRSLTLVLWCSRLITWLVSASNSDVTILRGSVCYDNFFARGRRKSSHITQIVQVKSFASTLSRHAHVPPHFNEVNACK